jgi:Zn-finger nucleic acid-binding protein
MKCPHCEASELKPTMIEEYLPAMGCNSCHGSLVSLLYYRHWAETQKPSSTEPPPKPAEALETTETSKAVMCPKCARLMTKYKLTGGVSNRIDVCNSCDEAWLDGGEWELLESLQLSLKMPAIFTEAWQRRIRHQLTEETRRSILVRLVGAEGAKRVEDFKTWIAESEHKTHILTYLYKN